MLYRLHQCHVIHADIKPDNIANDHGHQVSSISYIYGEIVCTMRTLTVTMSTVLNCIFMLLEYTILLLMYIVIHVL